MSKELTAMQMLIKELDVCMSNLGKKTDQLTRFQRGRLVDAKLIAKSLLQKEQEQIEQAFDAGYSDAFEHTQYITTNYYQSKYGGE